MQSYTVYLYLETALHISGGTFTHHQERTPDAVDRVVFVPDDGWKYHPKHLEQVNCVTLHLVGYTNILEYC
jgi:hypothetical protein